MLVLAIGTRVKIAPGLQGLVTAICIRDCDHTTYQVAWVDGAVRYEQWLERFELECWEQAKPLEVGFYRAGRD